MRLTRGQVVRCSNAENTLMGKVLLASEGNDQVQSIAVCFGDVAGIRNKGTLMVTNMLPLLINYKTETVEDLWGNEWEIDVAEA